MSSGFFSLQLDKNEFMPEDTVTGAVNLNLIDDFPGNTIFLKIEGHHKSTLKKSIQDIKTKEEYPMRYKIPIYTADDVEIKAGQYQFPFSFKLPANLIPSADTGFIPSEDVTYMAFTNVKYEIEAELHSNYAGTQDIQNKQEIYILPDTKFPEKKEITIESGCCCCVSTQQIDVKCSFDNPSRNYYPEEELKVSIEIDKAFFNGNQPSLKLAVMEISKAEFPGLQNSCKQKVLLKETVKGDIKDSSVIANFTFVAPSLPTSLHESGECQPSVNNGLMEIKHSLHLECGSTAYTIAQFHIVPKHDPPKSHVPPNFKPQCFETRVLALSKEYDPSEEQNYTTAPQSSNIGTTIEPQKLDADYKTKRMIENQFKEIQNDPNMSAEKKLELMMKYQDFQKEQTKKDFETAVFREQYSTQLEQKYKNELQEKQQQQPQEHQKETDMDKVKKGFQIAGLAKDLFS